MSTDNIIIGLGLLFSFGLIYVAFLITKKIKYLRIQKTILEEVPQVRKKVEENILSIQQRIEQIISKQKTEEAETLQALMLDKIKLEVQRHRLENKEMEIKVIKQISNLIFSGVLDISDLRSGNVVELVTQLMLSEDKNKTETE